MADPLSLLRQFTISGKEITERDGLVIFGDVAFSKNAKTSYVKYGTGKENEPKEYYTTECLVFFLKNTNLRHPVYVKRAVEADVPIVNFADRKDLLAYLNGEIQVSNSIDKGAPLELPTQVKRHHEVDPFYDPAAKKLRIEDEALLQKEKERLATMLDSQPGAPRVENIRDLSETLTVDKISEIRMKLISKRRTTIKATEEETGFASDSRRLLESELDVMRDIVSKERQWRTRANCLEAPAKDFLLSVFPILQSIRAREESGKLGVGAPQAVEPQFAGNSFARHSSARQPSTQYNRYAQEALRQEETGDFKIDTLGSYHGVTLKSITEGAKPKVQALPSATLPPSAAPYPGSQKPQKRTSRTPIIVIPASLTSLVNTFNARELLEGLRYVSAEEKKASGARKEFQILIQRVKENGLTIPYQVIDNPMKLSNEEWDRVVAVFVQGPAWQFKGWPYGANPVDIFARIAAFHVKWEEQKLDPNVAKWNVNVLTLSRTKRHLDRAAMLRFWEILDK